MSTNQSTGQREVIKYSTQLPHDLIKWVKLQAVEKGVKDYRIIEEALEAYRAAAEHEAPLKASLFDLAPNRST